MKGSRRFGMAVAVGVLATVGLTSVTSVTSASGASAGGSAASGSASAAALPGRGACGPTPATSWFPLPAAFFVGDPVALYPTRDGAYNSRGSANVAYKITGQFPHSTTMSFTTYNNIWAIPSPAYAIEDRDIIPDRGSVNPFVPGTQVMAPNRNYTVYIWPDSVAVPAGLHNVVKYPTKAFDPRDRLARWFLVMRMYKTQPGYRAIAESPKLTAVSALNPSQQVRCPLNPLAGTIKRQVGGVIRKIQVTGPITPAPESATGDKIYFTRYPAKLMIGPEGYPADGCVTYLMGMVPPDKISVVTQHQLPQHFNNALVTPSTIMKDFQVRWSSQTIAYWPETPRITVNQYNSVLRPDGSWSTIYLPPQPRLTRSQLAVVRALARERGYNVLQLPPNPKNRPLARLLPWPAIVFRQKAISQSFTNKSVLGVPCWAQNNPAETYSAQNSPAFFAKYASNRGNMGNYYIDGTAVNFGGLMSLLSKK